MRRRHWLSVILLAATLVAGIVLFEVAATVFLALTVVLVTAPAHDRLVDRGLPPRLASTAVLGLVVLVAIVAVVPILVLVYLRREAILAWLGGLPETVTLRFEGLTHTVDLAGYAADLEAWSGDAAVAWLGQLPALSLKLGLFLTVVYGMLLAKHRAEVALRGLVPPGYGDVADRLFGRSVSTLNALYVLQLVTALGTFFVALPVFYLLGYEMFLTLAVLAGLLQFLPIVGPSLVILALVGGHLIAGELVPAILVGVVGGVLVAGGPDLVLRPILARHTASLSGTLYFVGFVGGLLSVGLVGAIAGPLVVAILIECGALLREAERQGSVA